jgi:hypothetical protein
MHLAVKLISVVKRIKRIIGTGMCQITEFIKMFLPFTYVPVKAFRQGVKPIRDLVLCTNWRHWIDRCRHTKAVNKHTWFLSWHRSSVSFISTLASPLTLGEEEEEKLFSISISLVTFFPTAVAQTSIHYTWLSNTTSSYKYCSSYIIAAVLLPFPYSTHSYRAYYVLQGGLVSL